MIQRLVCHLLIAARTTLLPFPQFIADGPEEDPSLLPVLMPMYASVKSEVKKEEPERTDNIKSKEDIYMIMIVLMYSFTCYFSRLQDIAHY